MRTGSMTKTLEVPQSWFFMFPHMLLTLLVGGLFCHLQAKIFNSLAWILQVYMYAGGTNPALSKPHGRKQEVPQSKHGVLFTY